MRQKLEADDEPLGLCFAGSRADLPGFSEQRTAICGNSLHPTSDGSAASDAKFRGVKDAFLASLAALFWEDFTVADFEAG